MGKIDKMEKIIDRIENGVEEMIVEIRREIRELKEMIIGVRNEEEQEEDRRIEEKEERKKEKEQRERN